MPTQESSPFTLLRRLRAYAKPSNATTSSPGKLQPKQISTRPTPPSTSTASAPASHAANTGPSLRACTNDGQFAGTSEHNHDLIKIACRQHLQDMAPTRCELVASLGEDLSRYAVNFQELQRKIRRHPKLAATYEFELQDIRRRLRPNNFYTNTDCPHQRRRPA